MEKIEVKQDTRIIGLEHSSKGNQMKWKQDDYWYKADQFGYESLAEVVTSHLLMKSNITETTIYHPVILSYNKKSYRGCCSRNFRETEELLIPLERLFRNHTTIGLANQIAKMPKVEDKIKYTEEVVRNVTGIDDFGVYLAKLLEMDAFFFNEDRHTNNISILYNKDTDSYRLCPFYDMGLSLFADSKVDFPLDMDYFSCKEKITAKPFSRDFDEQLDAVNKIYGCHLKFDFSVNRVADVVEELKKEYLLTEEDIQNGNIGGYMMQEFQRVEDTLRYQAVKYKYMFQN